MPRIWREQKNKKVICRSDIEFLDTLWYNSNKETVKEQVVFDHTGIKRIKAAVKIYNLTAISHNCRCRIHIWRLELKKA